MEKMKQFQSAYHGPEAFRKTVEEWKNQQTLYRAKAQGKNTVCQAEPPCAGQKVSEMGKME